MRISPAWGQRLGKVFNAISNAPVIKGGLNQFHGFNPISITVASVVTKDAVGMYYYVNQALNNERIPEDKRKFVAGMDAANGIFNIVGQLLVYKPIEKFFGWTYDKFLASKDFSFTKFDEQKVKVLQKGMYADESTLKSLFFNNKSVARNAFVGLGVLVGLQVFMKRVITPLFATPLATYVKPWLKDDKELKAEAEAKKNGKKIEAAQKTQPSKQIVAEEFKSVA